MTRSAAHARSVLPLLATLALAPVAGCDMLEMPEQEEFEGDTDGDAEDVDEDDGSGEGPSLDPQGDNGDGGGELPEPGTDAEPFDNDPAQALGALAGMGFACFDAEDTRYNLLFDSDRVTVRFDDGTTSPGTYQASADELTLSVPELGFTESAIDAAVALDALVYFETPSLRCGAFSFDYDAPDEQEIVTCPTIKYVPGVSWEENEFHFGNAGYVLRRSWTELPMVPDTLYSSRSGLYRTVGDRVYIALPFEDEGEQWLSGTITEEGVFIDQLEPEQGACG